MNRITLCLSLCSCALSAACNSIHSTSKSTPDTVQSVTAAEPRQFVKQAAQSGMWQVESSKIAVTSTTSVSLRDFACMLIKDHEKTIRELQSIAMSKSIVMPAILDSEHQSKLVELLDPAGSEFDAKYYAMQVAAHEEAIDLFEVAADDVSDPDLRAFAKKTLPILRDHRDELKKAAAERASQITARN